MCACDFKKKGKNEYDVNETLYKNSLMQFTSTNKHKLDSFIFASFSSTKLKREPPICATVLDSNLNQHLIGYQNFLRDTRKDTHTHQYTHTHIDSHTKEYIVIAHAKPTIAKIIVHSVRITVKN